MILSRKPSFNIYLGFQISLLWERIWHNLQNTKENKNEKWLKKKKTGQKPSRRTDVLGTWDELVATMSSNMTLEFLATKSKLKQENPIQSSLGICKKYFPRPLGILKFWNIFLECTFSSQNWHTVMSGNKETTWLSECWVAGEAPR